MSSTLAPTEPIPPETAAEELNMLIDTLQQAWAYADWNKERVGLDLNVLRDRYTKKLDTPLPYASYVNVLTRFAAELHDGHAGVALPPILPSDPPQIETETTLPATVTIFDNHVYIKEVLDETRWDRVPSPGDRLVRCGDKPLPQLLSHFWSATSGSTKRHRQARLANVLPLLLGSEVANNDGDLTFEKTDGSAVVTRVRLIPYSEQKAQPISVEWIQPTVAHVKVPSFVPARWFSKPADTDVLPGVDPRVDECITMIDAAFRQIASAQTVILDLRGNDGGTDILGRRIACHLLAPGFTYYKLVTRHSEFLQRAELRLRQQWAQSGITVPGMNPDALAKFRDLDVANADLDEMGLPTRGWSDVITEKPQADMSLPPFAGQLILLTDSNCFSAADNLIACLQDEHPRVITVGEATGGGTGAPRVFTLPHTGIGISFCTMKVYRPGGGLIEGIGSEPDIAVTPTPDDLRHNRDVALSVAMQLCEG